MTELWIVLFTQCLNICGGGFAPGYLGMDNSRCTNTATYEIFTSSNAMFEAMRMAERTGSRIFKLGQEYELIVSKQVEIRKKP